MENEIRRILCRYTIYGYYEVEIKTDSGNKRKYRLSRNDMEKCLHRYNKSSSIQILRPLTEYFRLLIASAIVNHYRVEFSVKEIDGNQWITGFVIKVSWDEKPHGLYINQQLIFRDGSDEG